MLEVRVTRRYEGGTVTDHLAEKLIQFLCQGMVRVARSIYRRPILAGGMYLLALLGVLSSPFGRSRPAPRVVRYEAEEGLSAVGALESPDASVLREIEGASLRTVERVFKPGETMYAPGDLDDRLYFLLSGTVRTYKMYQNLKEATTALLKDGGVFGALDLAETGSQEEFAEALTETRVVEVRKAAVAWLVKRKPEVSFALFSAFSDRRRMSDDLIASLLPREVSSRLAALLLNLAERFGEDDGTGTIVIDIRLSHQELANMIASTREAVSKSMSEFRRNGLLSGRTPRTIVLLNREALSERAEGGVGR